MKNVRLDSSREVYCVFARRYMLDDFGEVQMDSGWVMLGETTAKSEKQAISNVRHKLYGDWRMFVDGGRWLITFEFEAHTKRSGIKPEGFTGKCGVIGEFGMVFNYD